MVVAPPSLLSPLPNQRRLLQESLGGRAKTCILATLSPADDSAEESSSTLSYASDARGIKNKPVTNSLASKRSVLKESSHEVEEMRQLLQAQRDKTGASLDGHLRWRSPHVMKHRYTLRSSMRCQLLAW